MLFPIMPIGIGIVFWVFISVILVLEVWLLTEWDGTPIPLGIALFALAAMVLFSDAHLYLPRWGWWEWVWIAVGWFAFGGLWSLFTWWRFVRMKLKEASDYYQGWVERNRGRVATSPTSGDSPPSFSEYMKSSDSRFERPSAWDNKERITNWIVLWPFSLSWWVLSWPRKVGIVIRDWLMTTYEMIAEIAWPEFK